MAAGFYRPQTALWLAFLAPVAVYAGGWAVSPMFTRDDAAIPVIRDGALYGTVAGALVAFLLGLWTLRSCKQRNSAFLAPVALGFFAKLFGLCLGTWICFRQIGQGSHFTYAFCFVAAAFGWQLIFTPSLLQMRGQPKQGPGGTPPGNSPEKGPAATR